jgi:hypothetical protein
MSITVSLINYDVAQLIESSLPRSNDNSNWFGPAGVSLPHDICRSRSVDPNLHISTRTQIPQNLNRSALPGSTVPTTLRRSSLTDLQNVLHGTPTIFIRPVCSCLFKLRINRGKGLPEYVASTTSHDHRQLYNDLSLIDTDGGTTSRLHSQCKSAVVQPPARSRI